MIGSGITAAQTQDQFMQLLVAQLRDQDPLDPVSQENFLQQLAQFAELEGIEKLNAGFGELLTVQQDLLRIQELSHSSNLIGRRVSYVAEGAADPSTGTVDSVEVVDGAVALSVDGESVTIDAIRSLLSDAPGESTSQDPEPVDDEVGEFDRAVAASVARLFGSFFQESPNPTLPLDSGESVDQLPS